MLGNIWGRLHWRRFSNGVEAYGKAKTGKIENP
jgi:hypothetical protein